MISQIFLSPNSLRLIDSFSLCVFIRLSVSFNLMAFCFKPWGVSLILTNREEKGYKSKSLNWQLKKKRKKERKKISTDILIENPKTQNKNESNLNLPNQKKKNQLKATFHTQIWKMEKEKIYRWGFVDLGGWYMT